MLILMDLTTITPFQFEQLVEISANEVLYVVQVDLYRKLRATEGMNVDMAYLYNNHVYLLDGKPHDELEVCTDNINLVEVYGESCDAWVFFNTHNVTKLRGDDDE